MTSVDTNVVVRLLTGDDPAQAKIAQALLKEGPTWIAKTVLLETAWVLDRTYGYSRLAIHEALTTFLGLENIHAEDPSEVRLALSLVSHGVDIADAMHLASSLSGSRFVSFDRVFVRRARRAGLSHVFDPSRS
jgi:predicted nucleic-acid-binding protein